MTHINNIATFVREGFIYAPSYRKQKQWSTDYHEISNRRESMLGGENNNVAFYFSPITDMAFAVASGRKVKFRDYHNNIIGPSNSNDIVYMVMDIEDAVSNYSYKFTDQSYNSETRIPNIYLDWDNDKNKINWSLFNETPRKGRIPDIGYNGAGKYCNSRDEEQWVLRGPIRMAEFWIQDKVDINHLKCFIVKEQDKKEQICDILRENGMDIAVYAEPDAFF